MGLPRAGPLGAAASYDRGMDGRTLGLAIVVAGLVIALVGTLVMIGALSWVGRLPGDIRIEGESTRVYVPITTMVLVSIVLTILATLLRRFL